MSLVFSLFNFCVLTSLFNHPTSIRYIFCNTFIFFKILFFGTVFCFTSQSTITWYLSINDIYVWQIIMLLLWITYHTNLFFKEMLRWNIECFLKKGYMNLEFLQWNNWKLFFLFSMVCIFELCKNMNPRLRILLLFLLFAW